MRLFSPLYRRAMVWALGGFRRGESKDAGLHHLRAVPVLQYLQCTRRAFGSAFNRQFFSNGKLWLALLAVVALQVVAVHWGPAQRIFDTVDLSLNEWAVAVAVASSTLFLEEARKLLLRFFNAQQTGKEVLMFSIYGISGQVFNGTLEQMNRVWAARQIPFGTRHSAEDGEELRRRGAAAMPGLPRGGRHVPIGQCCPAILNVALSTTPGQIMQTTVDQHKRRRHGNELAWRTLRDHAIHQAPVLDDAPAGRYCQRT
jgi:hypothetical protein